MFAVNEECPTANARRVVKKRRCGLKVDDGQHVAVRFLQALCGQIGSLSAVWVCPWGDSGAFALDTASGRIFFEPAHIPTKMVDSIGAGDTFILFIS